MNRRLRFEEHADANSLKRFADPAGLMPNGSMMPLPSCPVQDISEPCPKAKAKAKSLKGGGAWGLLLPMSIYIVFCHQNKQ